MARFVTRQACEALAVRLGLMRWPGDPATDRDWEFTRSDATLVVEFCDFYESAELSEDERFALMAIILDSWNSAETDLQRENGGLRERILALLRRDAGIHQDTIEYWALLDLGDDPEHIFTITPAIRTLRDSIRVWWRDGM